MNQPSSFISGSTNADNARITATTNHDENNKLLLLEYRQKQIAGFRMNGHVMICLPQAYQYFLSDIIGGMHTVYTKLKRLGIQPIICNVEQVRQLRSTGAIQNGVNRCKLIKPSEFDQLYDDCRDTNARPGRPAKRVSPVDQDLCGPVKRISKPDSGFAQCFWAAQTAISKQNANQFFERAHQCIVPSTGMNHNLPQIFNQQWYPSNKPQQNSVMNFAPRMQSCPVDSRSNQSAKHKVKFSDSFLIANLINDVGRTSTHEKNEIFNEMIDTKFNNIMNEVSAINQTLDSLDDRVKQTLHQYLGNVERNINRQMHLFRKSGLLVGKPLQWNRISHLSTNKLIIKKLL